MRGLHKYTNTKRLKGHHLGRPQHEKNMLCFFLSFIILSFSILWMSLSVAWYVRAQVGSISASSSVTTHLTRACKKWSSMKLSLHWLDSPSVLAMQSVRTATNYIQSTLVCICALGPPHILQEFSHALSKSTSLLWQKYNLGAPLRTRQQKVCCEPRLEGIYPCVQIMINSLSLLLSGTFDLLQGSICSTLPRSWAEG